MLFSTTVVSLLAAITTVKALPDPNSDCDESVQTLSDGGPLESPTNTESPNFDHHAPKRPQDYYSSSWASASRYSSATVSTAGYPSTLVTSTGSAQTDDKEQALDSAATNSDTTSSTASSSSASSTSLMDPSIKYSGIATFYSVGDDNCGTQSTDSDLVCAISKTMYNQVANSDSISEYCGGLINIQYGSKSVQVKVVDSCASCDSTHLDLSPAAFDTLADASLGVIDITWEWA